MWKIPGGVTYKLLVCNKNMGLCLYMSPDSHMKTHQTTFISLHHNRIKFRRYLFYLQTFKRCNIWCPKIVQGFWSNVTALFHVFIQHVPYLLFHFDTFLCLVGKETFFISPKMSHFIKVNLWLFMIYCSACFSLVMVK